MTIYACAVLNFEKLCHSWSTMLNCIQQWDLYGGPLFVAPIAVHASNAIYTL